MFQESEILFHTAGNHLLYQETDMDKHFGILKLKASIHTPASSPDPIYILFSVDCSFSMSGVLSNNFTKIAQVVHTLKRMFEEFAKAAEHTPIHVAVVGFEQTLHHILDFVKITPENVDNLMSALDTIEDYSFTNIEIALKNAADMLNTKIAENKQVYHVFMTDGQITAGEDSPRVLKNMLNHECTTIFIGMGQDHDSQLLAELSNYLRGEYYFIDKCENSTLVYGEIVYNILHRAVGALKLTVRNGLIYNWATNLWVGEIDVACLANHSEKIYQLMTYGNIHDLEIDIISHVDGDCLHTVFCYPPLMELEDPTSVAEFQNETDRIEPNNLCVYYFRQKTQELLFETRLFLDNSQETGNDPHDADGSPSFSDQLKEQKKKLRKFLQDMLEFMKANNLIDDPFMRRIGDDIYVLYHTMGREDAQMWCSSRQVSQGRQQTYMATQFLDTTVDELFTPTPRATPLRNTNIFNFDHQVPLTAPYRNLNYDHLTATSDTDTVDFWNDQHITHTSMDLSTASPQLIDFITSINDDVRRVRPR